MKSIKLPFVAIGLVALVFLSACSTPGGYEPDKYRVPEGSTVELKQALQFPGRSARVYIQFGETVRRKHVNEWEPFCSFGLNRNRDGEPLAREVGPTTFTVRSMQVGVDIARRGDDAPGGGGMAAGAEPLLVAGLFGNDGPGGTPWPYLYITRMELFSDREPQVDDLTCAVNGAPPDRNLTVDEIRGALGDIVRIE